MREKKLAPITPGEILSEEFLKPLGLAPHRLALDLRVPANRIAAIIDGKRAISVDTAMRLGRYFGTSAEFWINLQTQFDLRKAKEESGDRIAREVAPRAA